ncbi:MAG: HD-GYP domain-containing protein [Cycloclasticus sp.]|nr:HD-GYP domain-containing protein [Cycloclasticus sp.]MBQ0790050.1 HD-GYP domain-containing protein [Cycloclasticus sp.]
MIEWILKLFGKKPAAIQAGKYIDETKLTYVKAENLELGMYVAKLDRDWLDSPFKLQGLNLRTHRDLQAVRSLCQYVYVDHARQSKLSVAAKNSTAGGAYVVGKPPNKLGSFEKEIERASSNYRATGELITDFMQTVKKGGSIKTQAAKEAVAASVNSILHSPDAHLWLTQLKNKDEYTAQHSLNVCMLSIVLGRHIGLTDQELKNVGLCGMMHDMGKMLIPDNILNKPGELDDAEMAIMKTHTTLGAELLKSSDNMFYGAIETALTHHERIRGQGYPHGLKDADVSYYSNIVSIVDTYDALISDKPYKKGMTHLEATQVIYQQAGDQFDRILAAKFIESLGVFPPGCYVQLSDNQIALVLESNEDSKLRPRVMPIMDKYMMPIKEKVINLEKVFVDAKGRPLRIQTVVNPEQYNIDRHKHFDEGIVANGFAMAGM